MTPADETRLFPIRLLDPINPRTQIERVPGIDARCEAGKDANTCAWPYCQCKFPDRELEAA